MPAPNFGRIADPGPTSQENTQHQQTAFVAQAEYLPTSYEPATCHGQQKPNEKILPVAFSQPSVATSKDLQPDTLETLESEATQTNPSLRKLAHRASALSCRASYVGRLPDPKVGTNIFASPIETAAGSQRANLSISQLIPWLKRLKASQQRACVEAIAARKEIEIQRLRIIRDVRLHWNRLYVINKQIETNSINKKLLESLIKIANARVSQREATQTDVLLGTVELGKLAQEKVLLEQRLASTKAMLNRTIGRDASTPIIGPQELGVVLPNWDQSMLLQTAITGQPVIEASRLQRQAARWGITVACNRRRPDIALGISWYAMDDNRPATNIVDVGQDAVSIGLSATLPVGRRKYSAIRSEANHQYHASSAEVDNLILEYDALIADLWSEAQSLYRSLQILSETILPQARRSLAANQKTYSTGVTEFDRLIHDYRNLLALELQHHELRGQLANALARIRQAVGIDLN